MVEHQSCRSTKIHCKVESTAVREVDNNPSSTDGLGQLTKEPYYIQTRYHLNCIDRKVDPQ